MLELRHRARDAFGLLIDLQPSLVFYHPVNYYLAINAISFFLKFNFYDSSIDKQKWNRAFTYFSGAKSKCFNNLKIE